jgi:hypothetical protein
MGSGKTKTGKVDVRTAIGQPEGQKTLGTLEELLAQFADSEEAQALSSAGTELLNRDTLSRNLGLAGNLIADQMAQQEKGLSRSLVGRGVGDSGFATSQLLGAGNQLRGNLLNEAVARSSQEEIQSKLAGSEIIKSLIGSKAGLAGLLSDYVANLLSAGTAGQASSFAARQGARTAVAGAHGSIL